MLRAPSNASRTLAWKSPVVALRKYTTSESDKKGGAPRIPLSVRLGGSGRGKPLEAASDPFSLFLANAKNESLERNKRRNQARRMPLDPNREKQETQPGQFDDVDENSLSTPSPAEPQASRRRQQSRQQDRQQNPRRDFKTSRNYPNGRRQERAVATPFSRATTFIDKEIDWASLSPLTQSIAVDDMQGNVDQDEEQLKLESAGDYERYISMTDGIKLFETISAPAVCSLMGGNAAYNLQQKASFVALVSKVAAAGSDSSMQTRK